MKHHEAEITPRVGVVSISTSRYEKYGYRDSIDGVEDESGKIIIEGIKRWRYEFSGYRLVSDSEEMILKAISNLKCDAVITTGGTGLNPRDVTVEALKKVVQKEMEGFGEIFRWLSFREIGGSAILSRAFAGVWDGKIIFCLPGSRKAVKLAVEKIIMPNLIHVISHVKGLR